LESSGLVGIAIHDGWAEVFIGGDNNEVGVGSEVLWKLSLLGSEVVFGVVVLWPVWHARVSL